MPRKRKVESERIEIKSQFKGAPQEWLKLIKTITALANTNGGEVRLYDTTGVDSQEFDSARLDDKVNRYVEPRIQNIESVLLKSYTKIVIHDSLARPHVFKRDGPYQDSNQPSRQRNEFYKGQVWVRHSAKNELATSDDYERMFQGKQDEFMKRLRLIAQIPLDRSVRIDEVPGAIPIKIVKRGAGLPAILIKSKPHLAREVIAELKKRNIKITLQQHTQLWKRHDGKNPAKEFGVAVGSGWYWYPNWIDFLTQELKGK